ncbi:DUF2695 domain-containing protein [Pseudonocardia adelaidensis]
MTNFFDDIPDDDYDELDLDRPGLSLSLDQQVELANAVAAQRRACDGTLSAAQEWAKGAGVHWPRLRRELEDNGGYCDCEVVLNVFGGDFDRAFDVGDAEPD